MTLASMGTQSEPKFSLGLINWLLLYTFEGWLRIEWGLHTGQLSTRTLRCVPTPRALLFNRSIYPPHASGEGHTG